MIEGEAGIGKTRLARRAGGRARAAGPWCSPPAATTTRRDSRTGPSSSCCARRCETASRPVGRATLPPQRLADASLLLPELAELGTDLPDSAPARRPRRPGAPAGGRGRRDQRGLRRGREPGIVFLDDVHAADEATVDAISYLGRRLRGRALLLVIGLAQRGGAARPPAPPPGGGPGAGRKGDDREPGAARRGVRSRARSCQRAAERPMPDLARRVYVESEGLPLFVAEYLAALHAGDGRRRRRCPARCGASSTRGSGARRRGAPGARRAAAIGRSFDLDTVREASGRSDEETVGALEELVAQGVVREAPGPSPSTTSRTRSSARWSTSRRASRGGACSTGVRRPRCRGRRPGEESAALVAAAPAPGGRSRGRGGAATASPRSMPRRCTPTPTRSSISRRRSPWATRTPAALHERIGDLRTLLGDYGGALASYESAAAQSEPSALAAIEHKLGDVHHRRGEWERAEARFLAALDAAPADERGLRARIQADLALTLHHAGRAGARNDARARGARARGERGRPSRPGAGAQHARRAGPKRGRGSRPPSAQLERSLALARELRDDPAQAAALNNLALVKRDAGELPEALALTESALALCAAYGDRHREAALENNLADLHHAAGARGRRDDPPEAGGRDLHARWAPTRRPAYPRSGSSSAGSASRRSPVRVRLAPSRSSLASERAAPGGWGRLVWPPVNPAG